MRLHALEELRMWRNQLMERDKELVTLDLDIEEAEVEICSLTGLEMDAVESLP